MPYPACMTDPSSQVARAHAAPQSGEALRSGEHDSGAGTDEKRSPIPNRGRVRRDRLPQIEGVLFPARTALQEEARPGVCRYSEDGDRPMLAAAPLAPGLPQSQRPDYEQATVSRPAEHRPGGWRWRRRQREQRLGAWTLSMRGSVGGSLLE